MAVNTKTKSKKTNRRKIKIALATKVHSIVLEKPAMLAPWPPTNPQTSTAVQSPLTPPPDLKPETVEVLPLTPAAVKRLVEKCPEENLAAAYAMASHLREQINARWRRASA